MVYLRTGSSDFIVIFGGMIYNLVFELFQIVLYRSSLWRTDTIIFSKLNKPPFPIKPPPPLNGFEINKPPPGRGVNRGFTVPFTNRYEDDPPSLPVNGFTTHVKATRKRGCH